MDGKKILVTGGTGSFGNAFVSYILKKYNPKKIIIFSRDELKQYEMSKNIADNKKKIIRYFLGDVRDLSRLIQATKEVDYIVHAAALKQVPAAEYNPFEFVKTNIIGTQNVIESALHNKVKKIITLSTDKAAAPINLYGATKLAADKIVIAANNFKGKNKIKFSVVRYGNVFGSRGSVIPAFIKQKDKNFLTITDPEMTRFTITLDESVKFVIQSLKNMQGGEIFVPKIPSYKILDLAKAVSSKAKIKIIGIRPGEKLHEEMITKSDSLNTIEFKKFFAIIPNSYFFQNVRKYYLNSKNNNCKICKKEFSYNSQTNNHYLTINELKKLIKKNILVNSLND